MTSSDREGPDNHPGTLIPALTAFVVGLCLLTALFASSHKASQGGKFLYPKWMMAHLLVPAAAWLFAAKRLKVPDSTREDDSRRNLAPALILVGFMVVFLFSGAVLHRWFYFLRWRPDTAGWTPWLDINSGMMRFSLLTAALMPLLLLRGKRVWLVAGAILIATQFAAFLLLMGTTGGMALYRDDHPSFMFRLWQFGRTFPTLANYSPYWNGGVIDFTPTGAGASSIGLLFWPLWRFAPTSSVYTWTIGAVFIIIVPLLAVASLRIMEAGKTAAFCAGILAAGVSQHFFLWLLNYGTVGALFSSSFVLPVSACVYRVLWLDRQEKWLGVLLVVSTFFLLQWPPGALMTLPIAAAMILSARRWSVRKLVFLAVCGLVVLLLHLRTLLTILSAGKSVVGYVLDTPPEARNQALLALNALARGAVYLVSHLNEGHPLILFLGLGGIFVLPCRRVRNWLWPILLCFAALTAWGPEILPKLQLGRMAIPLLFIAVAPASVLTAKLLETSRPSLVVVRAALLALLALGGWNVARLYANEGRAQYTVLPPHIVKLAEWIRTNTPENSRVLFAGSTVHGYGRGHVAYLPRLARREMMACDYYHFPPDTVEYDFPPRAFRASPARFFEYLDLYNVGLVITYHDNYKKFLRDQPDRYREVPDLGDRFVSVFRVVREDAPFLKGSGSIKAGFNRIAVRLDRPEEDTVVKYNWSDSLRAPAPVELYPKDVGDGVRLIGIRPNGSQEFEIRHRSPL